MTPDRERQRYRDAANDALEQLDWCIGYLHGIGKRNIARHLARNRAHVRRRLKHAAAESLPSELKDRSDRTVALG